jgi:anaerobic magnesium-protoporphyrin IX monomethyl ester cyclase
MFKILLINPPREHLVKLDTPANIDLGDISSFPPVGLMYLAQALRRRNPEFEVRIIDAVAEMSSFEEIVRKCVEYLPNIVGITASTYTFYDVWRTAVSIKKAMPSVPIAVGGPHMYIFALETMSHPCFDYGIAGDGEEVFSKLCEALLYKKDTDVSPGLYYRRGNKPCGSGAAFLTDLDIISYPAIDLINPFLYYSTIGRQSAVGTICTSRGCPMRCTFCQVPQRRYLLRSVENVIKEVEIYVEKGITDFFFFDDLFNITKDRVVEFCGAILKKKLKIGWMFRGRLDQFDDDMLKFARRAGCHTISVGVEDSTDEGLKAIKKNITIKEAFEAVRLIRKNGIRCSVNWMIGFPSHRRLADLEHLLKTAIAINSDYAQFSILQCLPGSELYDQAVKEGGIDPEAWRRYVLNPVERFSPPIWERHLKKGQLYEFYAYAFKRYYVRPKVIAREILRLRSVAETRNKLDSFKKIFLDKLIGV